MATTRCTPHQVAMTHLSKGGNCRMLKSAGSGACRAMGSQPEVKSGLLYLIHAARGHRVSKTPMRVSVHRSGFEHYALLAKDQLSPSNCVFLSLKSCRVQGSDASPTQISVIPDSSEGTVITLDTANTGSSRQDWLAALSHTPSTQSRNCRSAACVLLPTLQELEEE